MASESGFDGGQENSLPATPLSSVMNRFRQFRDGLTSPCPNATPPVTSPTRVESFSETPARTSSNEPLPLNGDVGPTSHQEHRIVPRSVTPSTLLDASSITQELVNDEFLLQSQVTQQITQALDEARDRESEQNRSICEDCEAREAVQQQAEFAQFVRFQRFLATQAEVEQSTSDSSNDTRQDVMPSPSSMEGGSNNGLAMNQSASTPLTQTRPSTVITHTNCPLCEHQPNSIGHTIENCPNLAGHQLRLTTPSETQPPTNHNVNLPPPSSPTIETSSISRSIRRQVATIEQTMNNGMVDSADNVSQVTGPIDLSIDASTSSSPMPTGWKTGLSRQY